MDPWCLLANQPSLLGEWKASESSCLNKQCGWHRGNNICIVLWPAHVLTHVCNPSPHACISTHTWTCIHAKRELSLWCSVSLFLQLQINFHLNGEVRARQSWPWTSQLLLTKKTGPHARVGTQSGNLWKAAEFWFVCSTFLNTDASFF